MDFLKNLGDSDWWFGDNSMFASALNTAGKSGLTGGTQGGFQFSVDPQIGMSSQQITQFAMIGLIALVVLKK